MCGVMNSQIWTFSSLCKHDAPDAAPTGGRLGVATFATSIVCQVAAVVVFVLLFIGTVAGWTAWGVLLTPVTAAAPPPPAPPSVVLSFHRNRCGDDVLAVEGAVMPYSLKRVVYIPQDHQNAYMCGALRRANNPPPGLLRVFGPVGAELALGYENMINPMPVETHRGTETTNSSVGHPPMPDGTQAAFAVLPDGEVVYTTSAVGFNATTCSLFFATTSCVDSFGDGYHGDPAVENFITMQIAGVTAAFTITVRTTHGCASNGCNFTANASSP